jgi:hypothetical protein
MNILFTLFGALLGCALYLLFDMVLHYSNLGPWSVAIEIVFCMVGISIVARIPWPIIAVKAP